MKLSTIKKGIFILSISALCGQGASAQVDTTFEKIRLGGYGEMLASWKDYGLNRWSGSTQGNAKVNHAHISIPRFVLAMDYKFNDKWMLGSEIEFEAGGTGTAMEMEAGSGSENGEYETEIEKGGEVALEQFHITRYFARAFSVKAGHIIVPVGLTNTHHEPINFFTTFRPEGATTLLPCTWHETGLEFFGTIGKEAAKFDYQAQIVAGQNPLGFSRYNWIKGGKQGLFEMDNFTSPAYVFRLDYLGVKGLRLGMSMYYCHDAGKNCDRLITFNNDDPVNISIFSADAQYKHKFFTLRGNYLSGKHSKDTLRLDAGRLDVDMFTYIQNEYLTKSCANCHGLSERGAAAGLFLTEGKSHAAMVNVPSTKRAGINIVTPYDTAKSSLHLILWGNLPEAHHNHKDKLAIDAEKELIDNWILGGGK